MTGNDSQYSIKVDEHNDRHATFTVKPLDRGNGITLGNAMRRILLTAIPGAAITSIKVKGVQHEFSTFKGVIEDVADIVLNLKQVRFNLIDLKPDPVILKLKSKGAVKAAVIGAATEQLEVLNPDLVICTLNGTQEVEIELRIGRGKGYVSAENNKLPDAPIGTIFLDSIYNPVTNATFEVTAMPASKTQQEKLTLEVYTDGSISPKDAVNYGSAMLHELAAIFTFEGLAPIVDVEDKIDDKGIQLRNMLKKSIDEMELSVRSHNCLQAAGILSIYELVTKEENEMLRFKNFGRKSLTELQEKLGEMGLYFGMKIDPSLVQN
ncbi:MAG: DNA-directed RNA polymerase subunit alpha [Candidatus Marinimicrobia bacterium]|nr:DNA-directed RNA polymerase subunit alpha [Candidatus Neomarinimicrobiota bacterium]